MKHLEYFENNEYDTPVYWAFHTDKDYLKKELESLNCSDRIIKKMLHEVDYHDGEICFIGKKGKQFNIKHHGSTFISSGYTFKGGIQLPPDVIEEIKAIKNSRKYNL